MKHFRVLLLISFAAIAVALIVMVTLSPRDVNGEETISLAPGEDSSGHLAVDMEGGGVISGSFASSSGNQVILVMLDQDQYADFLAGREYGTRFSENAASGTFTVDRPAMETCHVVVKHAIEPDSSEQVTITYTVSTMNWTITFVATGVMGAAAIGSGIAMIKQTKDRKAAKGPLSPYIDVVMFDDETGTKQR